MGRDVREGCGSYNRVCTNIEGHSHTKSGPSSCSLVEHVEHGGADLGVERRRTGARGATRAAARVGAESRGGEGARR